MRAIERYVRRPYETSAQRAQPSNVFSNENGNVAMNRWAIQALLAAPWVNPVVARRHTAETVSPNRLNRLRPTKAWSSYSD
jgi:hypothetical protein